MINKAKLLAYKRDRMAFRKEQWILEDGRKLEEALEDWQLKYIFEPLDSGNYNLFYLELPRKHAKTTTIAGEAIITEPLLGPPGQRIYLCAGDSDQASILLETAKGMIQRNPILRPSFKIHRKEISIPAVDTVAKVMSADADTAYGLGALGSRFYFVLDEFWNSQEDFWVAFYTATGAKSNWRGIIITTAGFDYNSICWKVREMCRKKISPRFYFFSAPGKLASWIPEEWVQMQRETLPPHLFQRFIENKWTAGEAAFLTREEIEKCKDSSLSPKLTCPVGRHFLGIDLGLRRDRTAAVITHKTSDFVEIDSIEVWEGTKDSPVLLADIEEYIHQASENFSGLKVIIDPWQAESIIQRIPSIERFTFTTANLEALSKNLYSLFHNGLIRFYPHSGLERELLSVNAKQTSYGWRIDHLSGGYSDIVMALGMSCLHSVKESPGSFYSVIIEPEEEPDWYKLESKLSLGRMFPRGRWGRISHRSE